MEWLVWFRGNGPMPKTVEPLAAGALHKQIQSSRRAAFSGVFRAELATVPEFEQSQIETILRSVAEPGVPYEEGRAYSDSNTIFNTHFKDRKWTWPEYEEWYSIFSRLNRWPKRWGPRARGVSMPLETDLNVLERMRAGELKRLLFEGKIKFNRYNNKSQSIDLLMSKNIIPELKLTSELWQRYQPTLAQQKRRELYELFMHNVYSIASVFHNYYFNHLIKQRKYEIEVRPPEDAALVELSRSLIERHFPPFFLGDDSGLKFEPYDWQVEALEA